MARRIISRRARGSPLNGHRDEPGTRMAVAFTGAVLMLSGALRARPSAAATPSGTKLISPVRGQAEIGYLKPVTKREAA